jgi:hypothetical protein
LIMWAEFMLQSFDPNALQRAGAQI